jgi:hypothetical protein
MKPDICAIGTCSPLNEGLAQADGLSSQGLSLAAHRPDGEKFRTCHPLQVTHER